MGKIRWIAAWLVAFPASLALHAQEPVASIGKRLAAESPVRWSAREVNHPLLGPIQFAVQRSDLATTVGREKILSLTYVSCQRASGTIAIELTNAPESAPATGLGPADLPRLVCNAPGANGALAKSELAASWEISALGDTLARGLSASDLRRCVSIDVMQNLALPPTWTRQTQQVALQITPYGKELDAVFARCGEATAYAQEPRAPVAAARPAPAARPGASPAPKAAAAKIAKPEPGADLPWRPARAIAGGRTNVRAGPSLDAAVVVQLDPGAAVLVQASTPPWWKVKAASGAAFSGYIREDRFRLERAR